MPKSFSIFNDTPELTDLSEMIFVEGGKFIMGSGRFGRTENLSHFYIGKYPVTQLLYEKVMGKNPSRFVGNTRPVEDVSWDDTQIFFEKLERLIGKEYRLPTEMQWEYAARGGNNWKDSFEYTGGENLDELGWHRVNTHNETKQVGLKLENQLGLYDMSGNIWEWCYWHDMGRTIHVIRGGSWKDENNFCRVSFRSGSIPNDQYYCIGFRVLCGYN